LTDEPDAAKVITGVTMKLDSRMAINLHLTLFVFLFSIGRFPALGDPLAGNTFFKASALAYESTGPFLASYEWRVRLESKLSFLEDLTYRQQATMNGTDLVQSKAYSVNEYSIEEQGKFFTITLNGEPLLLFPVFSGSYALFPMTSYLYWPFSNPEYFLINSKEIDSFIY
jgi:hypothetical protein